MAKVDEDYFTIGNATYKEIALKRLEDYVYSEMKKSGTLHKDWVNSEKKARKEIRDFIPDIKVGKRKLEKFMKEGLSSVGLGYNDLWAVRIDTVIKDLGEIINEYLQKFNIHDVLSQDIYAKIFMDQINIVVSEELTHSKCDYLHNQSNLDGKGRDKFFSDFIHMEPIRAIHKKK